MKYSEVEQESHVYILTILNNDNLQIAQSQSLIINTILTDNKEIVSSPNLLYSSSDEDIATIDKNGIVSILNVGNVVISVSMSADNTISDSINIEIIEDEIHNYTVEISGSNFITKGFTSNYSCIFKDNGNVITKESTFWLTGTDNLPTTLATITSQNTVNNTCIIRGDSLGYIKLWVKSVDEQIVSKDGMLIQIKNLF